MLDLVPELNQRQCSRLRVERFGYRSFYVRYKTGTMPWIMNKTTARILDMCDGVATVFQIIEQMKESHNNVPDVKISDDTVKALAQLTTMGFLKWREPFSSRSICQKGFSLVSEMLIPRLDIFMRKINLGCNDHSDWGYLELDPDVAKVATIAVPVDKSRPTEKIVVATDEDGEICGAVFVSILSVSKTCVHSELCLITKIVFNSDFDLGCLANMLSNIENGGDTTFRIGCFRGDLDTNVQLKRIVDRSGFRKIHHLKAELNYNDIELYDLTV